MTKHECNVLALAHLPRRSLAKAGARAQEFPTESVELEFGFGLLPGNQRFASVFGDCCFEIAEVFEIFDTLLKSSHGLIECLDLFENRGVTHKLPFDLLQHKLESCRGPTNDEARITNDEGMTKHECNVLALARAQA